MAYLPREIRDRPVLKFNWTVAYFNKHLGVILKSWPTVGLTVEGGRPVLFPSDCAYTTSYKKAGEYGVLSHAAKDVLKHAGFRRGDEWVMVWEDGRLVGYKPEEAPQETKSFEVISADELKRMRNELARLRRLAVANG